MKIETQTLITANNQKVIVTFKPSVKLSYYKELQRKMNNLPIMLTDQAK